MFINILTHRSLHATHIHTHTHRCEDREERFLIGVGWVPKILHAQSEILSTSFPPDISPFSKISATQIVQQVFYVTSWEYQCPTQVTLPDMTGPEEPPAVYSLLTLDFCVVLVTLHWQKTANPLASGSPLGTSSHEQWKLLSFVPCEFLAPKIVLLTSKGQHMFVKCVAVHSCRVRDFYVKNLGVCTVTSVKYCSLPSFIHIEGTTQNIICFRNTGEKSSSKCCMWGVQPWRKIGKASLLKIRASWQLRSDLLANSNTQPETRFHSTYKT